jgi:hypothetical protein
MPLPYPELPFDKFTLTVVIQVLKLADIIFETMNPGRKQDITF